jgi:hypothetical protein
MILLIESRSLGLMQIKPGPLCSSLKNPLLPLPQAQGTRIGSRGRYLHTMRTLCCGALSIGV